MSHPKYGRDHGWNAQWRRNDPATRADFYARVFTGLIVAGVDDLVDFNCQSAREEGNCFVAQCGENLQPFRDSLLERRTHERLACRPFSRHLRMIHASDNHGHHDDHLPPGQGAIDWPRILALLRDSGFRGSLMMEIAGHGEPAQMLAAARHARQFLRRTA